jgi:adenylyltransferase/sulfurtransferase
VSWMFGLKACFHDGMTHNSLPPKSREVMSQHLSMYDSLRCSFLRIKKPPRQAKCLVCGPDATIKSMTESAEASKQARGPSCSIDNKKTTNDLPDENQITPEDYEKIRQRDDPHILLDVRVPEQFDLCSLAGAVNICLKDLEDRIEEVEALSSGTRPVYCMCRRGIASVSATQLLSDILTEHPKIHSVTNIKGGLDEWRRKVDKSFPRY